MAPPRPPRDPNRPKPPRAGKPDAADKRPKSPSAAARDARRAEQHAATRPPRPQPPREPAKPPAPDRRRGRAQDGAAEVGRTERSPDRAPPAERAPSPSRVGWARAAQSTTRPARPPRAARPRDAERSERPPAAGRADRPERAPARPERGTFTDRPSQRADRPARAPNAERRDDRAPPRADRPARGERPAFATRADRATAVRGERPSASAPPRPLRAEAPRRGAARHERAPAAPRPSEAAAPGEGQRIAKLLARAGIASRREIERMIEEGRVAIAGVAIDTAATILKSLHNVTVDGKPVQAAAPTRLFRYHKPAGLLTAERDPAGRTTIYDRLPLGLPRVMPVGRLDLNTEGLLLLTTDGEFKRQLELPATGVERTYRARVFGEVSQAQLEDLIEGVEIEGVRYGAIDANLERRTGRNGWVEMKLREGKNREVRRVLEFLGLQVSRLIRTAYGPFALDDMAPGDVDEVRQHDLVAFRKTLK